MRRDAAHKFRNIVIVSHFLSLFVCPCLCAPVNSIDIQIRSKKAINVQFLSDFFCFFTPVCFMEHVRNVGKIVERHTEFAQEIFGARARQRIPGKRKLRKNLG